MNRISVLFFLLSLFFITLNGQNQKRTTRVDLIRADDIRFEKAIAPDARRLIGDVRFQHEDATMRCDSAWQFTVDNRFNAYGNVKIQVNDSVEIFGDKLYYNGNTRIAEIHGNVMMVDNQMTLTTQHLYTTICRPIRPIILMEEK
jgi:lipopolysaccharide assembly outer membrane protein LptD (OstA)